MLINKNSIILRRPEKGFSLRKLFSLVNVLFFWAITVYFMRSLFSAFGWTIIYLIFGRVLNDAGFYEVVRSIFMYYIPLILFASLILWAWAGYNRVRYGGSRDKRRVHPPYLTIEQISEYTNLPVWKIRRMQNSKILVCHFDEKRELSDVDCFGTVEQYEGEESIEDLVEVDCFLTINGETFADAAATVEVEPVERSAATRIRERQYTHADEKY